MGYRSEVYIAVSKELYVKCQLLNNIPKALQGLPEMVTTEDCVYWLIEGWKWYPNYPEVQEIEAWFDWCIENESGESDFGAIRLGEETGDIQEWGSPWDFELYVNQSISCPVDRP